MVHQGEGHGTEAVQRIVTNPVKELAAGNMSLVLIPVLFHRFQCMIQCFRVYDERLFMLFFILKPFHKAILLLFGCWSLFKFPNHLNHAVETGMEKLFLITH